MQDTGPERGSPVEFLDPAEEIKEDYSPDDRLLMMLDRMQETITTSLPHTTGMRT